MTLGTKLRNLRLERGFSQTHVAEFIGLNQSTYCRLESDKSKPKLDTALKIAKLYQIEMNTLFMA